MSPVRRYRFKPALLSRSESYTLDGKRLVAGDGWEASLDRVTGAAFVNHVMKGARLMRLDLRIDGATRSLSYTGDATGWRNDADAAQFLALLRDVLDALQTLHPALKVALGEQGGGRIGMFAVGLVSALAGIGIFTGALASGVSGDRLAAAAVPMLLLTVLGALLTYRYGPWRKPPVATPEAVARAISGILDELDAAEPAS